MTDFENEYIKGKSLEQLIDALGLPTPPYRARWCTRR